MNEEQPEQALSDTTRPRVIIVGNLTIDDVVLPDGSTQMASAGGNSLYAALGCRLWQGSVGMETGIGSTERRASARER